MGKSKKKTIGVEVGPPDPDPNIAKVDGERGGTGPGPGPGASDQPDFDSMITHLQAYLQLLLDSNQNKSLRDYGKHLFKKII